MSDEYPDLVVRRRPAYSSRIFLRGSTSNIPMAKSFGSLVFTPVVKALQERYGSRQQYARIEQAAGDAPARLGPDEIKYLAGRDTF